MLLLILLMPSCSRQTAQDEERINDTLSIDALTEVDSDKYPALIQLLNHPIDLQQYKLKKRGANSSAITQQPYYYQPDTVGTYFSYFWFQQLRDKYPPEQLFKGLVIKTYVYGSEIGTYEGVTEELIGIKSKLSDPDLGTLDLVGKDLSFLKTELGLGPNFKEHYIVERLNQVILIIKIENQKVQWFNYLHTSLQPKVEIPEALLYFDEQVPKIKP